LEEPAILPGFLHCPPALPTYENKLTAGSKVMSGYQQLAKRKIRSYRIMLCEKALTKKWQRENSVDHQLT